MTVQNETRWLLETIIEEWPATGSLGGDAPPENLILRDRDDGVNYYADADADDPDAPDGYEGVRETTTSHDGFATVGISEGAVTREFYGNKPQYDVTTRLTCAWPKSRSGRTGRPKAPATTRRSWRSSSGRLTRS